MKRCMAFRSLLDAGHPGGGRLGLQSRAVRAADGHSGHGDAHGLGRHRRGAPTSGSASTRRCAINTLNGAYASREEAIKGSITPGKLADFVVLADDPHTVDPEKIKDIQIVRTVVGGTTMYQA